MIGPKGSERRTHYSNLGVVGIDLYDHVLLGTHYLDRDLSLRSFHPF